MGSNFGKALWLKIPCKGLVLLAYLEPKSGELRQEAVTSTKSGLLLPVSSERWETGVIAVDVESLPFPKKELRPPQEGLV